MAQFGKADIGLIKATAGAEQSKFVDSNLMTGMAVSGLVDELNKKATVQAGIQASIKKDIDDKFNAPTGNLSEQFTKNLAKFLPGEKNKYANVTGSGVVAQNEQNNIVNGSNTYMSGVSSIMGKIQTNSDTSISNGPGHDPKTSQYLNQIDAGDYEVVTTYNNKGEPQPNVAVPLYVKPKGSEFKFTDAQGAAGNVDDLMAKLDQDPNYEMSTDEQEQYDAYNTADKKFNDWKADSKLPNGEINPASYQYYNDTTFPLREANSDQAGQEVAIYNENVSLLKNDADHEAILDASLYKDQWFGQVEKYSGVDLQHTLFNDVSRDKIDNAYGDLFVNQTGKDPDMYKNTDGEFITMTLITQQGGEDVATNIQYGSNDWMGLDDSVQKKLLQMHIKGEDSNGKYNPDSNSDFHKNGYARFMGNVTRDAGLIKQREHFEKKGVYFDNGDGNPINKTTPKGSDFTTTEIRKGQAYTYHKFDAAFPERLLSDEMEFGNVSAGIGEGYPGYRPFGSIEMALKEEFPDIDFEFPSENIIEIGNEVFDFSSTDISKKQQLKRLKDHVHKVNVLNDAEKSIVDNMSMSVKDEDWKKMRRKNYHGSRSVAEGDYLAFKNENVSGMPTFENPDIEAGYEENYGTNSVTGKLEVIAYEEETKMYTVKDERGNEHQVDEDTLYPKGI